MGCTTLISPDELYEHLSDPVWMVLDCRFALDDTEKGRSAYRASHIPGAVYVHLDEDLSGPVVPGETGRHPLPDPDAFAHKLGEWGIANTTQVVSYDDMGGPFAARLWWMLRWLGHDRVAVLDGGWQHWLQGGYPTTAKQTAPPHRTFVANPQPELLASTQEIERIVEDRSALLVDARAEERYAGIHEPIDPVAGHIPGAISYPFKDNLDASGRFKAREVLEKRFSALTKEAPAGGIVCYCGSGVTAAHNVLALTRAGITDARMYAGSWSKWITDSEHPIAR